MPHHFSTFMVTDGNTFRLADHNPSAPPHVDHETGKLRLTRAVERITQLQEWLAASATWSMLTVFQGMDAAGKDGAIDHVFSGVNPAGVIVTNFRQPSSEELTHDFLWRVHRAAPPAGRIGVFNRSHYEDVLVTRIHTDLLDREHLPPELSLKAKGERAFWGDRLRDINQFERMLTRQGIVVRKFFLHVSRDEQRRRLISRLEQPDKGWKFQPTDLAERVHWDEYMHAYQQAIAATATPQAPWYVIPADHKWFARMIIAEIVADSLEKLDLKTPKPRPEMQAALEKARRELEAGS